jgi:nucleoside-diphosphate-sugar epimerase
MTTILVTGASGFIGSALVASLGSRFRVFAASTRFSDNLSNSVDLSRLLGPQGPEIMRRMRPSVLIHCAAIAHRSAPRTSSQKANLDRVNVELSQQLALLSKTTGVERFVFLSTVGVHGPRSFPGAVITEDSALNPSNPYAVSKCLAEYRIRLSLAGSACGLTIIRPALVYGPGMRGNFLHLIRAIDAGLPFPLGSVENQRSFVSIANLLSAIELASFHPSAANNAFVIADLETISTAALVRLISNLRHKPCRIYSVPPRLLFRARTLPVLGPKLGQLVDDLVVDSSKARLLLGWQGSLSQSNAFAEAFALP